MLKLRQVQPKVTVEQSEKQPDGRKLWETSVATQDEAAAGVLPCRMLIAVAAAEHSAEPGDGMATGRAEVVQPGDAMAAERGGSH